MCILILTCILFFHRMAGRHMAALRVHRLLPPFRSTVTLPAFVDLNSFQALADLVYSAEFEKYLFALCRAPYPWLRILRLADKKSAVMDKLLFFVRQASIFLPRFLAIAEAIAKTFLTDDIIRVMTCTKDILAASDKARTDNSSDDSDSDSDSEAVNEEEEDQDSKIKTEEAKEWPGNSLVHRVMRIWVRRKKPRVHSYSLVGHLCSPNPIIIADAVKAMSTDISVYEEAVEDLIKKLLLDPNLVGDERIQEYAYLTEEFWKD